MKKIVIIALIGLGAYGAFTRLNIPSSIKPLFSLFSSEASSSDEALQRALDKKHSAIQVGGSGKVITILPHDTQGSRHQRVIVRLDSGQTPLMAHALTRSGSATTSISSSNTSGTAKVALFTGRPMTPAGAMRWGWLNHGGNLYR
ncbi:protein of unknown function duf3465 [Desulfoluna spongiiphila]|nr:DUF3465 domain-containing protein [Desulfoluna spongiiphila]VVS95152.1 protein of unknown function duf3465 [Desulfoluna spongiiphila]